MRTSSGKRAGRCGCARIGRYLLAHDVQARRRCHRGRMPHCDWRANVGCAHGRFCTAASAPPEETIPAKFHSFETSNLNRTVGAGENVFDFELADL